MATTKFYLDKRAVRKDGTSPLKLSISHQGKTTLISLDVYLLPEQWEPHIGKILGLPNKLFLNNYIYHRKVDIETIILRLLENNELSRMNISQLRERIISELKPQEEQSSNNFTETFKKFLETKTNPRTHEIYQQTFSKIEKYDSNYNTLRFEDITNNWLTGFDAFLSKTSPSKNARNIHLRNIRAVFNAALDDDLTTFYPFRRFKIRPVATPKRSLSVEQLRMFINAQPEEHCQKYLDIFKLIFFLIGINIIDLCNLKNIVNNRIEYHRAKTNKLYSIKVEPEAMEIINKYKGENYLLDILDRYGNYKNYAKRINENLQRIGEVKRVGKGGKKIITPIFPNITTYWARHTWATIAHSIGIPKDTISLALGHSFGNRTTDIYIDFDREKIDEANRKVIDWVIYRRRYVVR